LWVLPLLVVTIGTALIAWAMRATAVAARELAERATALGDLGREAGALRAEVGTVATRARSLELRRSTSEHDG
jgi:hypothetical protein